MKTIQLTLSLIFTSLILSANNVWAQDMMCPEGGLGGKRMVINLANNDIDKGILAFNFALANQGCGADVVVFLSDDGTIFAVNTTPRIRDEENSLQTRIERFLASGGRVLLCPPCLTKNFGLDPMDASILIDGVEPFNPGLLNIFYPDGVPTAYMSW